MNLRNYIQFQSYILNVKHANLELLYSGKPFDFTIVIIVEINLSLLLSDNILQIFNPQLGHRDFGGGGRCFVLIYVLREMFRTVLN